MRRAPNDMMDVTASSSQDMRAEGNRNYDMHEQKKFVPPPEYDKNNSRWTLKYRELAPGLVELIKHSGVYVNADKLAECQKWSNDSKTFAGKLLTEIFTMIALSTCSWSELDERATDILLQFVVQYGQIRHWMGTDYQCILKAIRQVMLEIKCARQKKEEDVESKPRNEKGGKLVLLPEYDNNNPRWTLKYREYAPGLVELIEDSCVYVERSKLAKYKRMSDDSVTLARLLLLEIFTTSAMSICSVTDTSENSKQRVTNIRPRLDENAMTTLTNFVAEIEAKKGWTETDKKCILSSIRQKLEVLQRVKRIVEGQDEGKEEEEDKEENEDICCCNTKKRKFCDMPAEYDENDSRWTLKYREPAPGLVELIEHSSIYINSEKLAECKRLSNDCQTLARTLLIEIFTANALSICNLSNENRECFKAYNLSEPERSLKKSKPELDAHAEIILLNFVDDYALEKGWKILDFNFIENIMICKMAQMESNYNYKEQQRISAANDKKFPMC